MKKRMISLLLVAALALAGGISALALEAQEVALAQATEKVRLQDEAVNYYLTQTDNEAFGGIYYDGDKLIVNVVEDKSESVAQLKGSRQNGVVEYRTVKYSLKELEAVKDYLGEYMSEYSIQILDAHEGTNKVDIYLEDFSEKNIAAIREMVDDKFPGMDCLHFEDYSGTVIQFTVGEVDSSTTTDAESGDGVATRAVLGAVTGPGQEIIINGGQYTMGPVTSTKTGYSAGHGFTGKTEVKRDLSMPNGSVFRDTIGYATPHYGGSAGDWSSISTNVNSSFSDLLITSASDAFVEGTKVMMFGAVTSGSNGTVTKKNVKVQIKDGPVLSGMCEASYPSALGDSGAAIYPKGDSLPTTHFGVQSSATFTSNGTCIASYFTPLYGR